MVVPSDKTLVALGEACKAALISGAKSVLSPHTRSVPDKRLPLWIIPYWTEVSSLQKTWRTPWMEAEDCYKGTSVRFLTFPLLSSIILHSPLLPHTHSCLYVLSPTLCTITDIKL
jgi:hypothetical protein